MEIIDIIKECGYDDWGSCDAEQLHPCDEVREMCAADKCQSYNRNWACPPACGSIDHYRELFKNFSTCYIAQTWGQMEDSFDFETVIELAEKHDTRNLALHKKINELYPDALVLGAGACNVCGTCAYPDEPCRNPDLRLVSMEATGLVVNEVCTKAGVAYNHGPDTMAFTSCVLF